ncbi:MAG: MerR family DNA-binding protein [Acidobacteriota bacterium]
MGEIKIGEVARRAGVGIDTIRFYERRGLLPDAPRRESGYRIFSGDEVRLVRFIKKAQALGFTLDEVEGFLRLRHEDLPCDEARAMAEEKLADIEQKLRHLQAMKVALRTLVRSCKRPARTGSCPILEALETDES